MAYTSFFIESDSVHSHYSSIFEDHKIVAKLEKDPGQTVEEDPDNNMGITYPVKPD